MTTETRSAYETARCDELGVLRALASAASTHFRYRSPGTLRHVETLTTEAAAASIRTEAAWAAYEAGDDRRRAALANELAVMS